MCRFSLARFSKRFGHTSHWNGFSAVGSATLESSIRYVVLASNGGGGGGGGSVSTGFSEGSVVCRFSMSRSAVFKVGFKGAEVKEEANEAAQALGKSAEDEDEGAAANFKDEDDDDEGGKEEEEVVGKKAPDVLLLVYNGLIVVSGSGGYCHCFLFY